MKKSLTSTQKSFSLLLFLIVQGSIQNPCRSRTILGVLIRNTMKILKIDDTIGMGVYVGETVRDCIKKNGRRSILEILKYYDLDENILLEYHFRYLGPHKDEQEKQINVQEISNDYVPVEESFETTTTLDWDEEYPEPDEEVVDDPWYCPVDYDPEDDDEYGPLWGPGSSYKPWIYGK